MSGGRFEEAEGLPLSVLGELKSYRDLVIDVAGRLYRREHPRRKNLPNGFSRKIDLRLTGIKHGCVVAEITRITQEADNQLALWNEEEVDCVESARRLINETIKAIKLSKNPSSVGDFPPESLSHLYHLGSFLEDGEKITLAEADDTGCIDIDSEWRALVSHSNDNHLVERVIDGKLIGMSSNENTFIYDFLIYDTQKKIKAKLDINRWDEFVKFLDDRSRARMCSLSVVCKINDDGDIESIEQTYSIEETLPEKFANRMEELSHLNEGWMGVLNGVPQGSPIKEVVFKRVQSFLREVLSFVDSEPSIIDLVIFPQNDGGIQIEWKQLDYEVDFEINNTISAFNFSKPDKACEKIFSASSLPNDILNWLTEDEAND